MVDKPPLGLLPRHIAEERRLNEIEAAMYRYMIADKEIPEAWHMERTALVKSLNSYYNQPKEPNDSTKSD